MLVAALFTITKNCKQSKCWLFGDWINKMWYTSAIKKGTTMEIYYNIYTTTELRNSMVRERNQI